MQLMMMNLVNFFRRSGYIKGDENWQNPEDWLREDIFDPGYQLLVDEEIVASVNDDHPVNSNSESEDEDAPQHSVTHSLAFEAFDTALHWLESLGNTDPAHLLLVQTWRDLAACKTSETLKQKKNYIILLKMIMVKYLFHYTYQLHQLLCVCISHLPIMNT